MKRLYTALRRGGRRANTFFRRYINGTKGVISLFLAILMVPFVSIAGALINAARVNSAIAVFDEALCNASNSTLGTYDEFLKSRFGLLAMAQNTAGGGGGYSVENLISDTFNFYMQENLGALSNTYFDVDTTAAGVYPLSDTDVLLSEVMEYSKYTVPTKLVLDGLSIDEWLKKLTEGTEQISAVFDTAGSTMNVATSLDDCQDKLNDLKDKLDDCEKKKSESVSAYNSFKTSVDTYNAKVDEMKREVAKCEEAVRNAETALENADEDSYEAAKAALEAAKKTLEDTKTAYHNALVPLRNSVSNNKSNYSSKLTVFADSVKTTGEAAVKAQEAKAKAVESGVTLAKNVSKTITTSKKQGLDNKKDELKAKKEEAEKKGDYKAAIKLEEQMRELDRQKGQIGDTGTLVGAGMDAGSQLAVDQFEKVDFRGAYAEVYSTIINVRNTTNNYNVVQTDDSMGGTGDCYRDVTIPIKASDVEKILEDLNQGIVKSSFFQVLKALVGFIQALFDLKVWADPKLNGNISGVINSLPSRKGHSTSPYQAGDKAQSEYYKSIMGKYSGSALNTGSVSGFEQTINEIMADINTISENANGITWRNVLKRLAKIAVAIGDMGVQLIKLAGQMVQVISTAVYEKLLLAGYIGYNVPNRTTYTGSGLTGAGYELPSFVDGYSGAFNGAEAEYVIMGSTSEHDNQEYLFHIIYILRLLINLPTILMNGEVQSIAEAAGAVSFGIGTVVVLVLYCLAEPLVDTLILVNSGDLPVIKTKVFLTPSGVVDMIGKFYHLTLSDDQKNKAYKEVVGVMSGLGSDSSFASSYGDAASAFGTGGDSDVLDTFSIDYTQTLILIMLFISTESMLKRLGDVIQMEAAYQASEGRIDTYNFDLDKSYTYLRASGSFSTNEFIKLSDSDNLNSTKRVVYRGY